MLSYLQGSTRPDISMAIDQCASSQQIRKHNMIEQFDTLKKYLFGAKDQGIIYRPNPNKGVE